MHSGYKPLAYRHAVSHVCVCMLTKCENIDNMR
jgi:hypothetical protein